jgi:hypothetical protein
MQLGNTWRDIGLGFDDVEESFGGRPRKEINTSTNSIGTLDAADGIIVEKCDCVLGS